MIRYEDLTLEHLSTKRQRPMYLSDYTKFRESLSMKDYPRDPHAYTEYFLEQIDEWINSHEMCRYIGLEDFQYRDAILGTTQFLDELHYHHKNEIVVIEGEYKYHRRLTDWSVQETVGKYNILPGNTFVVSYPSCMTTSTIKDFNDILDHCYEIGVPVHIDGAWFGMCRNFEFDVRHPAIQSVAVSLSKSLGLGSQRIGIRYSRNKQVGPISVMNDFRYANVSDMWLGVEFMKEFGTDHLWKRYGHLYSKVCKDFGLTELDAIHVALGPEEEEYGIRTPLRMLIDGVYDERGTNKGLNEVELNEK